MNWRIVTIVVVTSIPIIVVAFILLQIYLEEEPIYEKCEDGEFCVRFCCEDESSCVNKSYDVKTHNIAEKLGDSYKIVKYKACREVFAADDDTLLLENGHIIENNDTIYEWDEYCADIVNNDIVFKICASNDITDKIHDTFVYFMIASMPFLVITLVVYGFIKDLRNLHGKCLIAYVFSLTVMYATLITIKQEQDVLAKDHKIACITIGYTLLSSILCCFCWLSVMCYDIFRTFRKGMKSEDTKQFLKYCGYAFGIPIVIGIINFILNFFEFIPDKFNNSIGNNDMCSVPESDPVLQWIYIYGPIMFLLTVNVSLYGITAWKIFHVQQETTKICKSGNSRRHAKSQDSNDNHTRFLLYMRLSVVMGVPWIVEVWSFIHGKSVLLFIASIFNCMQGFVVFITFVWNPKVTKQLKRRYTVMTVSYKNRRSSKRIESAKGEIAKGDSVDTAVTKINGIYSESSDQA